MEPLSNTNSTQESVGSHSILESVTETISSVVEKTKEIIGLGSSEEETADSSSKEIKPAQDSSTALGGLTDKAAQIKDTIQQKAIDAKDVIQQKASDTKEVVQKKVSEWMPSSMGGQEQQEHRPHQKQEHQEQHHQEASSGMSKKMRNWSESIHKIEKQHEQPIVHPNSHIGAQLDKEEEHKHKHAKTLEELEQELEKSKEEHEEEPSTSTGTLQNIQNKLIDVKDAAGEKLVQAKDVVAEKVIQAKDAATEKVFQTKDAVAEKVTQAKDFVGDKMMQAKEAITGPSEQNQTVEDKSSTSATTELKEKRDEQQQTSIISTVSGVLHTAVETGIEILEKAGSSIASLATGTATTNESDLAQQVEPLDEKAADIKDRQLDQPSIGDKARQAAGQVGDKMSEWKDQAASKIDQWTEGSLGEVSVVDPTKKNKEDMMQPGQPKLQEQSNQSLVSEQVTSA